ncbi:MAG: FISUMP domain-containing protein [Bacteroidota bacterium]
MNKSVSTKVIFFIVINLLFFYNTTDCQNSVGPLIQTQWHQKAPYNDLAPEWNYIYPTAFGNITFDQKSVAGCGAIAVAQLLRYYQHLDAPQSNLETYISGFNGSYKLGIFANPNFYIISANSSDYNFDYNLMSNCNPTEANLEVSELTYIAGVAIKQSWGPSGKDSFGYGGGTSTTGLHIINALKKNLGFKPGIFPIFNSNIISAVYVFTNEINHGRPLLCSLQKFDSEGKIIKGQGHFVLIDGYNSAGEFHINWGWGGTNDGWYNLENLGVEDYTFHYALVNIIPKGYNKETTFTSQGCTESNNFRPRDNSNSRNGSVDCPTILFPTSNDTVVNNKVALLWEDEPDVNNYLIHIKSLTTNTIWYDDVETYGGNPYFETAEILPTDEQFEFTLKVEDENGNITSCTPLTFYTHEESCELTLTIDSTYCSANGQGYHIDVNIDGFPGVTYDLFAKEEGVVITNLNAINEGDHQITIASGKDVAIIVEQESNPLLCSDAASIIGPSCQNFQSLDLNWPSSSATCFEKGTTQTVNWNTQGGVSSVDLELCNTLSFLCQDIEVDFNNLGFYNFNIPSNIDNGYYTLHISSSTNPIVQDYSNIFEINADCNADCDPVSVSLGVPNHKEAFSSGDTVHFSWIHNGPPTGPCAPQQYHIQLDDNTNFTSPQNEYRTINEMDVHFTGIQEKYWRVRIHYNNGDYGPWSAIRKVIIYDSSNLPLELASCINYENPICSGGNNQVTVTLKNDTPFDWNGMLTASFLDSNGGTGAYKELSNKTILAGQTKTFIFNVDITLPPNNDIVLAIFEQDASTSSLAFVKNGSCSNILDVEIDNCFSDLDFTWDPEIIVEDQPIDFDDVYNGGIVYSNWYFEGGVPDSITDNSNANDIVFPTPGYYDVELEVMDGDGTWYDITKTIQVYSEEAYLPDLYVSAVSTSPDSALAGQTINVNWSVQNDGIESINFKRAYYYFSEDSILSSDDSQYSYDPALDYYDTNLANGGTVSDIRNLQIPSSAIIGVNYIILEIEDYNHSSLPQDSDSLNNIIAISINIVPTLPDLTLEDVSITTSIVESGEEFDATATFVNMGNGEIPGNPCVKYNIYLSEDDTLSINDFNYGTGNYIDNGSWCWKAQYFDFPGGNSHTRTISTLPHTPSGDYFLLFCIDIDIEHNNNQIDETDESNNIIAIPITVSNPNQPTIQASNLRIKNIEPNSVSLTWNNGNGSERLVMGYNQAFQYRKPLDDSTYVANSDWDLADKWVSTSGNTDNNSRILYQGTDSTVIITNLDSSQTYFFSIFELNYTSGLPDYLQAESELQYTTTRDTSEAWQRIYLYPESYFESLSRDIEFINQDTVFIAGTEALMTSFDTGNSFSFKRIYSIGNNEIQFESIANAGSKIIAVGHNDLLVTSQDYGKTWNTLNYDPSLELDRGYSVHFVDNQNGFIAARKDLDEKYLLYGSTDGGDSWNVKFNSDSVRIYDIANVGNSIYVVGQYGKIFKSNNLGENWFEIPNNLPQAPIYSIAFTSPSIAYCTEKSSNGIYKSIDGGYNWQLVHTAGFVGSTAKLKFFDSNKGYYVTNNHLLKTLDGGITWDSISLIPYSSIPTFQCVDLNESGDVLVGGFDILKYDNISDICTLDVFNTNVSDYGSLSFAIGCANPQDTINLLSQLAFDTIWVEDDLLHLTEDITFEANLLDSIVLGTLVDDPLINIDSTSSVTLRKFVLHSGNNQNAKILINNGTLLLEDMILHSSNSSNAQVINNGNIEVNGVSKILNDWTCGDPLDYLGQSYATVQIGNQCWMAENLNVGTMINGSTSQSDNAIIEKYCYENDTINCETYGGLYQWNEMLQYITNESSQGICPEGWHLPSDSEIKSLEIQLGMSQAEADQASWRGEYVGSKLAGEDNLWIDGPLENNAYFGTSGFNVIPGGLRFIDGTFGTVNAIGIFWSSTENGDDNAWYRLIYRHRTSVARSATNLKNQGISVRCVQD